MTKRKGRGLDHDVMDESPKSDQKVDFDKISDLTESELELHVGKVDPHASIEKHVAQKNWGKFYTKKVESSISDPQEADRLASEDPMHYFLTKALLFDPANFSAHEYLEATKQHGMPVSQNDALYQRYKQQAEKEVKQGKWRHVIIKHGEEPVFIPFIDDNDFNTFLRMIPMHNIEVINQEG